MLKNKILSLFELDRRSIVAFRIAAGLLAVYDALIKFPHIRWLYSKEGYRDFLAHTFDRNIAIHELIASLSLTHWQVLICIQMLAGAMMILGWRPRLWLVVWLVVLRLTMRRNDLAATIGDLVFTFFAYAVLFLPMNNLKRENTDVALTIGAPWSLPYYTQLFCLYFYAGFMKLQSESWTNGVFFIRAIQSHGMWERLSFLAEYPDFLHNISLALPFMQIYVSLSLIIPWKKHWIRGLYIVFWILFHIVGHILVPEATLPFYVTVPLIVLIPKEFWQWIAPSWGKGLDLVRHIRWSWQNKISAVLAVAICIIFVTSNHFSIYYRGEAWAQKYFDVLSRTFLYQYWSVFSSFSKRHHTYKFLLRESEFSDELIELPDEDRAGDLISGRFVVMKRALHTGDMARERWAAAACLHMRELRNNPKLYGIMIRRYTWEFTDEPPIKPKIEQTDEKKYECDMLIKKHIGHYN